jgi:hypothetical protein
MKVKVPLLLLLLLAAAVGFLLGTENGRQKRDQLVSKIRNRGPIDDLVDEVEEAIVEAAEPVSEDSAG